MFQSHGLWLTVLSPVILWTCAMFFVFFNPLIIFWQEICVPNPLWTSLSKTCIGGEFFAHFSGGLLKFHDWNRRRSTIWNNFGKPEHTHALYGGLIVRFKPLKFHIFWDTWGYVWTRATSVTGDKFLISQAAPTLRSEGGGTELLERSWKT